MTELALNIQQKLFANLGKKEVLEVKGKKMTKLNESSAEFKSIENKLLFVTNQKAKIKQQIEQTRKGLLAVEQMLLLPNGSTQDTFYNPGDSALYLPAEKIIGTVMIGIGAKTMLEMTLDEAKEFYESQIKRGEEQIKQCEEEIEAYENKVDSFFNDTLRVKFDLE